MNNIINITNINNKQVLKYISYTLLVSWCLVIFYLSAQEAPVSSSNSVGVLEKISNGFLKLDLGYQYLTELNGIFRTFMHGCVFCILGVLTFISGIFCIKNYSKNILYSLIFCCIYSLSDEIHQLFVQGRAFEVSDLIVDNIGSVCGIALICAIIYIYRKIYNSKKNV